MKWTIPSSICHSNFQSISDNKNGATSLLSIASHVSRHPFARLSFAVQHIMKKKLRIYSKTIRNSFENWPDLMKIVWRLRSIYLHRIISCSFSFYSAISSWLWFSSRFVDFFFFRFFNGYSAFWRARIPISCLILFFCVRIRCHLYSDSMQMNRAL